MPIFIPSNVADNITLSLMILAGVTASRWAVEWAVTRRCDVLAARRRRFTMRAVCNAAVAIALLGIWLSEIQNIVFSLAAVMVALVVATKELLMCVAGSVLRFGGHLFKVGDRIELTGIHGEVIDHGLFSTTIMELPPHHLGHAGTGRMVMLPNSILLTGPVRVEPQPRQYAPHRFTVTLETQAPPRRVVELIMTAADAALAADMDRATRFHRLTAGKAGADIAGPGHDVAIATSDLGKLQFHVMIYCLVKDARALEQAILLDVLEQIPLGERAPRPAEAKAWAEIARQLREGAGQRREAAA